MICCSFPNVQTHPKYSFLDMVLSCKYVFGLLFLGMVFHQEFLFVSQFELFLVFHLRMLPDMVPNPETDSIRNARDIFGCYMFFVQMRFHCSLCRQVVHIV